MKYDAKKTSIEQVIAGMELAGPLYSSDGRILLCEGTILTPGLIQHLRQWGCDELDIKVGSDQIPSLSPAAHDRKKFYKVYKETVQALKNCFEITRVLKTLNFCELERLISLAKVSVCSLVNTRGVISYLYTLRQVDDYTFNHSVNVAIIVGILGKWVGYKNERLEKLILAGLLHDVGKTQIPLNILNKPGKLLPAEMELMKKHTTFGHELIIQCGPIPWDVACGILQHHERLDGSGYPGNLTEDSIHINAKIIAIADIYDAMTSNRVYRRRMTPYHVVETLRSEMFGKIDPEICTTFLINITDYLIGNIVKLSDGSFAEVVAVSQNKASRPIVRIVNGGFIDLEAQKELAIVEIVENHAVGI